MRWIFTAVSCLLLAAGCGPSVMVPPPPALPIPVPAKPMLQLPSGWSASVPVDTTGVPLEFLSSDNAIQMSVKELIPLGEAKQVLDAERMCVLAQLSLQSKIARQESSRRIIHLPEAADSRNDRCYYVYADGPFLRRVEVFRVREKYYEAEMRQAAQEVLLSRLADDQSLLIESLRRFLDEMGSAQ
ncbi:MAG: hypothetical protein NTV54_12805 [Ignavibacteriales bacterium]|nr:hypothetical protein [Ignavibacteriales bacterium]